MDAQTHFCPGDDAWDGEDTPSLDRSFLRSPYTDSYDELINATKKIIPWKLR